MNLVELKKVSLKINQDKIINDISLQLKKGQITTLIGPNGGGKTSIAKILLPILHFLLQKCISFLIDTSKSF